MEVRGQLSWIGSLLPCWTQVIRFGSKHLSLLNHLSCFGLFIFYTSHCPFPYLRYFLFSFYFRYLLDNPDVVRGKSVLDLGSGCGAAAIAAKMSGASKILANDIDPSKDCIFKTFKAHPLSGYIMIAYCLVFVIWYCEVYSVGRYLGPGLTVHLPKRIWFVARHSRGIQSWACVLASGLRIPWNV